VRHFVSVTRTSFPPHISIALRCQPTTVRQSWRESVGASYVRAHSATLLAWRGHPDLAWYVAGGALAVGAGLVVAGWG